jgi:ABC-type dipeptide/oligopeptide/nickel transport system ATPase subunit
MSTSHFSLHKLRFLDNGPYSFSLLRGECLGLKGPSGVGKTQLFRAITDLIPSVGDVVYNDIKKDSVSAVKWRSQVTMLPTDSVWWYDDVSSHFSSLEAQKFLYNMCVKLGLPKEIINWQVNRLSTGEKQRLSLIRSLQVKPAILLLDEPTSALDVVNTKLVEMLLLDLCESKTLSLIWVSHDAAQLERVSDRILFMDKTDIREIS